MIFFMFTLISIFCFSRRDFTYAEVNCKGRGSDISKRVPWEKKLDAQQINQFSKSSFIDQDGWLAKLPL
jgi:pectinesterase